MKAENMGKRGGKNISYIIKVVFCCCLKTEQNAYFQAFFFIWKSSSWWRLHSIYCESSKNCTCLHMERYSSWSLELVEGYKQSKRVIILSDLRHHCWLFWDVLRSLEGGRRLILIYVGGNFPFLIIHRKKMHPLLICVRVESHLFSNP